MVNGHCSPPQAENFDVFKPRNKVSFGIFIKTTQKIYPGRKSQGKILPWRASQGKKFTLQGKKINTAAFPSEGSPRPKKSAIGNYFFFKVPKVDFIAVTKNSP